MANDQISIYHDYGSMYMNTLNNSIYEVLYATKPSGNYGSDKSIIHGFRYGTSTEANGGSSYAQYGTCVAVKGSSLWGNNYSFGVHGANYNDFTRCGGVIGTDYSGAYWGSLGYMASDGLAYGMYAAGTNYWGAGSGYASNGGAASSVGVGSFGSMLGLWTRGEVMGQIVSGELFASYNLGNTYTSGTQIELVNTGTEKVAAYAVTSPEMKVYENGFASISGTEVFIAFEATFSKMLSEARPVVTITPVGRSAQLYIKSITKDGFTVVSDTPQQTEFAWIAVGSRIDAKENTIVPAYLKDPKFDENLKAFMYNENNKEHNGKAMWWDGSKLNFGELPGLYKQLKPKTDEIRLREEKSKGKK